MGRKIFILSIIFLPLIAGYNNCANSGGAQNSSVQTVSPPFLSFSGEVPYESFSADPQCANEEAVPDKQLTINYDQQSASLNDSGCSNAGLSVVGYSSVAHNSYNPYVIYMNQRMYVHPSLHQGYSGHIHYREFCFNAEKQIDFTIQYQMVSSHSLADGSHEWVGVRMYGPQQDVPGIYFNSGYHYVNADGSKVFLAQNGEYHVELNKSPQGLVTSGVFKDHSQEIELQCWSIPQ